MAKFKIGDKIKATADSDSEYLVTCKKRGWTGIVELKFFNCDGSVGRWNYSTDMIEKV